MWEREINYWVDGKERRWVYPLAWWWQQREKRFYEQLAKFGRKVGLGYVDTFNLGGGMGRVWNIEGDESEFCGVGLCRFASGAIERAINDEFGGRLVAKCVSFRTTLRNTDLVELKRPLNHFVVRVGEKGGREMTMDATHGQIDRNHNPRSVLWIPTDLEEMKYDYLRLYAIYMRQGDREFANNCLPWTREPNEIWWENVASLSRGEWRGAGVEDYEW